MWSTMPRLEPSDAREWINRAGSSLIHARAVAEGVYLEELTADSLSRSGCLQRSSPAARQAHLVRGQSLCAVARRQPSGRGAVGVGGARPRGPALPAGRRVHGRRREHGPAQPALHASRRRLSRLTELVRRRRHGPEHLGMDGGWLRSDRLPPRATARSLHPANGPLRIMRGGAWGGMPAAAPRIFAQPDGCPGRPATGKTPPGRASCAPHRDAHPRAHYAGCNSTFLPATDRFSLTNVSSHKFAQTAAIFGFCNAQMYAFSGGFKSPGTMRFTLSTRHCGTG